MKSVAGALFDLSTLRDLYAGDVTPEDIAEEALSRADAYPDKNVWIFRVPAKDVRAAARLLADCDPADFPLYGVPFAVKDNIDVAGMPTSAACPEYVYVPTETAPAVQNLIDAGAILIGKTNLDQFATGLVGVRSPYGAVRNSFDPEYVSGGSSSGSAVAVAAGIVGFSLGTDTAGSGRVPAGFNNIVGIKPTKGIVSTRGVVPACRSLDCVSVFSLTAPDGTEVLDVLADFDGEDEFSRRRPATDTDYGAPDMSGLRVGVPAADQLQFFGNDDYAKAFDVARTHAAELGASLVEIDFVPFAETAALLYDGPWVAERFVALREFLETSPDAFFPITRKIVENGRNYSAADTFSGLYRLAQLARVTAPVWNDIDLMLLPTAGSIYRIAEVEADPVQLNSNLGYYTNFVNLLDLSAIAVPVSITDDGLPFGVTLVGPGFRDRWLAGIGDILHRAADLPAGATSAKPDALEPGHRASAGALPGSMLLAVNGAHMRGLPLNHQMVELGATFLHEDRTSPDYRLFALSHLDPVRPGLIRDSGGGTIAVEIWSFPLENVGRFLAQIPFPLGLGKITLGSGDTVTGFVCEATATQGATEITLHGGWRNYLDTEAIAQGDGATR